MRTKILVVALAFLSASCVSRGQITQNQVSLNANNPATVERDYYSHMRPEHRAILRTWLEQRSWLRPAVEDVDSIYKDNPELIRREIRKSVHQYYSVGDFNSDRNEDFAVLLIDNRHADISGFTLAVFNGAFRGNQSPAYYEENFDGISNSYIVYDGMVENRLYLGVFESDYYCMTLIPQGEGYTYEDCDH